MFFIAFAFEENNFCFHSVPWVFTKSSFQINWGEQIYKLNVLLPRHRVDCSFPANYLRFNDRWKSKNPQVFPCSFCSTFPIHQVTSLLEIRNKIRRNVDFGLWKSHSATELIRTNHYSMHECISGIMIGYLALCWYLQLHYLRIGW